MHDQSLPGTEIEAGGRFVEKEQVRLCHECAGQEDLLAFPFGENPEGSLVGIPQSGGIEEPSGVKMVVLVVPVPPRFESGVATGEDDVMSRQCRPKPAQEGLTHEGDASAHGSGVAATVSLPQHLDGPTGRKEAHARHTQKCRLPRSVGPQDGPSLTVSDVPVDPVQDGNTVSHDGHAPQTQGDLSTDGGHGHGDRHRARRAPEPEGRRVSARAGGGGPARPVRPGIRPTGVHPSTRARAPGRSRRPRR